MQLTSSVFEPNQQIPSKYTCDGENVSPPLSFLEVPTEAQSLTLIVEDPDAISKAPWIHWVVYNIAPQTKSIAENAVAQEASEGMTDFGKPGWGGPCPPSGNHRYFFKLYALDKKLELQGHPDAKDLQTAMMNHIIAEAYLIGLYQRQR